MSAGARELDTARELDDGRTMEEQDAAGDAQLRFRPRRRESRACLEWLSAALISARWGQADCSRRISR
jgi:hypothetical protein